jgi:hypothetical protein
VEEELGTTRARCDIWKGEGLLVLMQMQIVAVTVEVRLQQCLDSCECDCSIYEVISDIGWNYGLSTYSSAF